MQQEKTFTVGAVAAGATAQFSTQFDTLFPDDNYAVAITLNSNSLSAAQEASRIKGLQIAALVKRPDGIDLTLSNPDATDYASDTVRLWASNGNS